MGRAAWEGVGLAAATVTAGLGEEAALGLALAALMEVRLSGSGLLVSDLGGRPGGGPSRPGGREGGGLVVLG